MEHRFSILRKHLNELGYQQTLPVESVPLVEHLLADLVKTTESLFHYKNLAQNAMEERDSLQLGAEPYKCDNTKLVKECNDLHIAFLQFREQTDKLQKDLKIQLKTLQQENEELSKTVDRLRKTSDKLSSAGSSHRRTVPSKVAASARQSASSVDTTKSNKSNVRRDNKDKAKENMLCNEDQIVFHQKEICKLKHELVQQFEFCECLKNKLNNRDIEIQRLSNLLEGGRPLTALNRDCCYRDMNCKLIKITEENSNVSKEKEMLEKQLADSISKQHEAMKRALQLADRNKELERELRDIDQMALAVEEQCNSTVKRNVSKVSKVQEQLSNSTVKVQCLEREISDLKRMNQSLDLDFETVREEKDNLHKILENALDDKKRMTDRINQFTRIEHDLNLEIDRLVQTCTLQKRKISELEIQLVSGKFDSNKIESRKPGGKDAMSVSSKSKEKSKHKDVPGDKTDGNKCPCCEGCKKSKKTGAFSPCDCKTDECGSLEKLKSERIHYQLECKRLQDELDALRSNDVFSQAAPKISNGLRRDLKGSEDKIAKLEKQIQELTREKHTLCAQLESLQDVHKWGEDVASPSSLKNALTKTEKERDLARGDIKRLEDERDSLRKRLKVATETHMCERDRLQKLMTDSEEKLRKLESERREMMTIQGTRRAAINTMEEQLESLKNQLRTTQAELEHIHTLYSQIKSLQEQTDRALGDTQGQLAQVEIEYAHTLERVRDLEKDRCELDKELSLLKNDLSILKGTLTKIDSEKDHLLIEVDNKTELIATLEQELMSKENKILTLETFVTEMRQKISLTNDDISAKDYLINSSTAEITSLKRELEECVRNKALANTENRRLQDDIAKINGDCMVTQNELDRAKREIEDLKTQLQQYVFEVKRAEDLISKKEYERAEMLDQFRSLSHEATVLENNNHSLESKATEAKCQLSEANDRIHDLDNRVEQLHILNRDYETQISDLTLQIAGLETQFKQHATVSKNAETELKNVKELCVKLDEQKDALMNEMKERDEYRCVLEKEKQNLKADLLSLRESLNKETSNLGSLENLLSNSRQETVEQRLLNEEMQREVQRLKTQIHELQTKLRRISGHSIENTIDVRLHPDTSPRSISSIFTNIMTKKDEKANKDRRQSAGASFAMPSSKTTSSSRKSPTSSEPATYRSHTKVDIGILKDRPEYRKSSYITETEEEIISLDFEKPSAANRTSYAQEKHVSYDDTPEIFHDATDNLDVDKHSTRSKSIRSEHRRYFKGPQPRKSAGGTEPTPSPESSSKISTSFDSSSKMDPTRPKSNIKNIVDSESTKKRTLIQYSTANFCCKCRNCGCES